MLQLTIRGVLMRDADTRIHELPGVSRTRMWFDGMEIDLKPAHNTAETLVAIRQLLDEERCVDRRYSIELALIDGEKRKEAKGSYFRSLTEEDWVTLAEGFDDDAEAGERPVFNPNPPPAKAPTADELMNQQVEDAVGYLIGEVWIGKPKESEPQGEQTFTVPEPEPWEKVVLNTLNSLPASEPSDDDEELFDSLDTDVVATLPRFVTIELDDGMTVEVTLPRGRKLELTIDDVNVVISQ